MGVDLTAEASVLGIETKYEDLRVGAVRFLPQRIAVFAQGESTVSYSTDKRTLTSKQEAGDVYGYRSPIALIARELLPKVGTIPVTVYPLADDGSGVAATADITPSGTATKASEARARIGGVLCNAFPIPKGAITGNALNNVLRGLGESIEATLYAPMKATFTYGAPSSTKTVDTGDATLTNLAVNGTPKPGKYTLVCIDVTGGVGTYELTDPNGSVISSTIVAGVDQVHDGVEFDLTDGIAPAEGDTWEITVPATDVQLVATWKGANTNDLVVEIVGEDIGVTWAITAPNGGAVNPSIDAALDKVGQVWETLFLNAMNPHDTTVLDAFQTFGEERWGVQEYKPCLVFRGNADKTRAAATATTSGRTDDRVNVQLVAPGAPNLPCVIAAAQLAEIAGQAQNAPPSDYVSLRARSLTPGADDEQWNYTTRDQAVKAGSSTVTVEGSTVRIGDVVTSWRPVGEDPPAYRDVVDIVKIMQGIYNLKLNFSTEAWSVGPLLPDEAVSDAANVRRPKDAVNEMNRLWENLERAAIISSADVAKSKSSASIGTGGKRIDIKAHMPLSGNPKVKSVDLGFSFLSG